MDLRCASWEGASIKSEYVREIRVLLKELCDWDSRGVNNKELPSVADGGSECLVQEIQTITPQVTYIDDASPCGWSVSNYCLRVGQDGRVALDHTQSNSQLLENTL